MALLLFLLPYTNKPPYSGPLRPFVNFVKYSKESVLVLYKPQSHIDAQYRKYLENKLLVFNNIASLINFLSKPREYFLFITDWYRALLFLKKLKFLCKEKFIPIIYAEVYHGTLNPMSMRSKVLFTLISRLLREFNNIVANSMAGFKFLVEYYKVLPLGHVYPPVNTAIFNPSKINRVDRFKVLLYLGSIRADTDLKLVRKIINVLLVRRDVEEVCLLGNKLLQLRLISEAPSRKLHPLIDVSDEMLAKVYSEVSLTICPQRWEPYGYVVAESIACRTPVLAFNSMGPKELVSLTKCGILVNSEKEMINTASRIDLDSIKEIREKCRIDTVRKLFSPWASVNKLMALVPKLGHSHESHWRKQ